jgi:hypothetical protein
VLRLPAGIGLEPGDRVTFPAAKAIPAQVALTGGSANSAKRTYLLLSVGPKFPHDHADAGAILLLSQGASCLIGTNGYLQRELLYHNVFFVQRADLQPFPDDTPGRAFMGEPTCAGELLDLRIDERSSSCRVRFAGYHGYPLDLEREIVVDVAGHVTLLDRVTAHEGGLCGGPLFHAEQIRRLAPNRFRLRQDRLLSMNGHEWRNGPGQIEVEFCAPAATVVRRRLREPAIYDPPAYSAFPTKHYREIWRRSYTARHCLTTRLNLPKEQSVLFLTRLTPV